LELKAEASGYTEWVRTPNDEDQYIQTLFQTEGFRLERAAIQPKSAKRGFSKLSLNSTWSNLTERNNHSKTRMISDPQEFYRFLATPGIMVANLIFASDEVEWV
jgi:hypothetical protein